MIESINNNLICIEQHAMESTRRGKELTISHTRLMLESLAGIEEVSMG
jgi:hypothetical protein